MHRHGYKGRKLGRKTDQRRALIRGLAKSLFEYGQIETTLPKARDLRRYGEKLITKARRGDLSDRRAIIAALGNDVFIANLLVDHIAPQIKRDSGYLRIERTRLREGDRAQMAIIEFVDEINYDENDEAEIETEPEAKKPTPKAKATETKKETK